jgi:hypothetical protein
VDTYFRNALNLSGPYFGDSRLDRLTLERKLTEILHFFYKSRGFSHQKRTTLEPAFPALWESRSSFDIKPISKLGEVFEVAFNVRRRMWIRKAIPSGKESRLSRIVDFAISRNFNRGSFRDGRSYNVPETNRAEPINEAVSPLAVILPVTEGKIPDAIVIILWKEIIVKSTLEKEQLCLLKFMNYLFTLFWY